MHRGHLTFALGIALVTVWIALALGPPLAIPRFAAPSLLAVGLVLAAAGLAPDAPARLLAGVRASTLASVAVASAIAVLIGEALILRTAAQLPATMFALNCAALAGLALLAIAVTNRVAHGIGISLYLFFVLEIANALKLYWLLIPVAPSDVRLLPDLVDVTTSPALLGVGASLVAAALLLGAIAARSDRRPRRRGAAAVVGAAALSAVWLSGEWLMGASGVPLRAAAIEGHFDYFLWHTRDLFVPKPAGYDRAAVEEVIDRRMRGGGAVAAPPSPAERPTVILYLIESFTDPRWFGRRFTEDPIPRFRALWQSNPPLVALAPGFGGGSANSEFELLTGLPVALLPPNRTPYVQDVWREIPSLPHVFKSLGYETRAVHAGRLRFYNIDRVYPLLGFDDLSSVKLNGAPLDAAGRYGSDESVVDEILRIVERPPPAFVFAFPASTHWPYDYDVYRDAPLDVLDDDLDAAAHHQLKTYLNAAKGADRALGHLVERLAAVKRPVLLVALGDHWPPLANDVYAHVRAAAGATFSTRPDEHRVPVVVWANYPVARPASGAAFSAFAPAILEMAGAPLDPYWKALRALGRELPTTRPDWQSAAQTDERTSAVRDLRLLEYDVLYGEGYARSRLASAPGAPAS